MGQDKVNVHRGDLGVALKAAAGFTIGVLSARHLVNEKAGAQRQAASLEHLLTTCQADANAKTQELQASQAASKELAQDLKNAQQRINELLSQLNSRKSEAQQLADANATHLLTIEGLQTEITTNLAESVRLEGLVLQEATAKAAAVNHASQLRKQADDLQDRLNAAVAAEHAARHELSVHKQQRDAEAEVLSKEKAVLQIQVMRLYAGGAAESRSRRCGIRDIALCVPNRLTGEVSAEKAARAQVEQACAQLGMQLLDLQRRLRASERREAAATSALDESMEQRDAEREVLIQEKAVLQNRMASMQKLRADDAAESCRLIAEVSAEKAAKERVEQTRVQLETQLLDLQCQLRASQTREAAATSDLDESMEQTDEAWRELDVEKDAHHLTAARSEREVEAYSIALRQAVAELDQQRLEAVQQLTGKQALSHHGARTSPARNQGIPSFQPIKGAQTTWSVAALGSAAFEARVRATHGHQGPFDMIKASFCSSNSGCKGLYRTFRGETIGLVGAGAHSSVY
ncbi:hypothetical protein ABBQ38_007597 [Trebouxia sp. C0009 RCD-2024]